MLLLASNKDKAVAAPAAAMSGSMDVSTMLQSYLKDKHRFSGTAFNPTLLLPTAKCPAAWQLEQGTRTPLAPSAPGS